MSTPDTEGWEKEFDEVFADPEWLKKLTTEDSMLIASRKQIKDFIAQTLTTRDTYWKERVRKEVEGMKKTVSQPDLEVNDIDELQKESFNQALDTLLDNLK